MRWIEQSFVVEERKGGLDDWLRLRERHPESIEIGRYAGDWGMGAGRFEIRAQRWGEITDLLVAHTSTPNNPIGPSPLRVEGLLIEGLEPYDIRQIRDLMNKLLGE